jgi:hypothetical protein
VIEGLASIGAGRGAAWAARAAAALAAGLAFAALLLLTAPRSVRIPVGAPMTAIAPATIAGVHGAETHYGHEIRWTNGYARIAWPGRFGVAPARIVLTLAGFPGRHGDALLVRVGNRMSRHDVPTEFSDVYVDGRTGPDGALEIGLTTRTSRPPGDARELGVRLEAVTLENGPLSSRLRSLTRPGALVVIAAGAFAWTCGLWIAGPGSGRRQRLMAAAVTWASAAVLAGLGGVATLAAPWLWAPPVCVVALTAILLRRGGHDPAVAAAGSMILGWQALVLLRWCTATFVDVPRWDIWEMVVLLVSQEQRGFAWGDLLASHNEHRPVVSRALILANIALARWNHWNELWALLGTLAVHVLVYVAVVSRAALARPLATLVALAGVGAFVATATQWENLLGGWQIAVVAGAASVTIAFVVLATTAPSWSSWVGAAAAMLVATGAFASCLVAWPLGALAIAVRRGPGWRLRCGAWLVVTIVVTTAYVHGLQRPAGLPPPAPILTSWDALLDVIQGASIALAMPVWYRPISFMHVGPLPWDIVSIIGATAPVLGLVLAVWRVRRPTEAWATTRLLPALLMLFAVGACLVTAIGRVPLGVPAMSASRYISIASLFWVGLVLLLTVSSPLRSAPARAASMALALLIVASGLVSWGNGHRYFEDNYVAGSIARDALLRGDIQGAAALFPSPPVLDARQQELARRKLSLFRPGAR